MEIIKNCFVPRHERALASVLLLSLLMSSGCGKTSNQVSATFRRNAQQDFARSEIISNGPGVADGQSELLVVIQLMNSDGSVVKLFRPTFEVVSGDGVTASPCTTSNENGISTCVLKAAKAGTKRISVTNIKINLQADVVFAVPPVRSYLFGLSSGGTSGASQKLTQGSFSITAAVGTSETDAVKTSGSYKLFGSVQGEAFSR